MGNFLYFKNIYFNRYKTVALLHDSSVEEIDKHKLESKIHKIKKIPTLKNLIFDFIVLFPIALIVDATNPPEKCTQIFLILIQLNRLLAISKLFWIFSIKFFKTRVALANILLIVYCFIILNHLVACIWILFGTLSDDFNYSWLAKIPAPLTDDFTARSGIISNYISDSELYTSSLYWAYITASHIGIYL